MGNFGFSSSLHHALRERGFWLARGGRRGHVAVDINGNVFAIARAVGVKAKEVRTRLGDANTLPDIASVTAEIDEAVTQKLDNFAKAEQYKAEKSDEMFQAKRRKLVEKQQRQRDTLSRSLEQRRITENKARSAQLPKGLKTLWFRVTGQYRKIKIQNKLEAQNCVERDQLEMAGLVQQQLQERRQLRSEITASSNYHTDQLKALFDEIASRRLSVENQPSNPTKNPIEGEHVRRNERAP